MIGKLSERRRVRVPTETQLRNFDKVPAPLTSYSTHVPDIEERLIDKRCVVSRLMSFKMYARVVGMVNRKIMRHVATFSALVSMSRNVPPRTLTRIGNKDGSKYDL